MTKASKRIFLRQTKKIAKFEDRAKKKLDQKRRKKSLLLS
jgi:hypothetical protein